MLAIPPRSFRRRRSSIATWLTTATVCLAVGAGASGCGRRDGATATMPIEPDASSRSAGVGSTPAPASKPPTKPEVTLAGQAEDDFVVKGFRFQSGETLPEVRIHYTTLGAPHKDASGRVDNAILLLHGTSGRGKAFFAESFRSVMFGANQPFDTTKYFVILPDNVGQGASSKPSDGLHARFPRYAYRDMIELQRRLVTEKLGIAHLRLVAGTSMGGMHTWMWSEAFPDMMDGAIPIACEPTAITGRNLVWRRIIVDGTRSDPAYAGGEYKEPPAGYLATLPVFRMMVDSPEHLGEMAPNLQKATDFVKTESPADANDVVYALDASRDYDPAEDLGKIKARVLAINFADDALNVDALGELEHLMPRVHGGRYVVVPTSAATHGHLTLILASTWQANVATFLKELPHAG